MNLLDSFIEVRLKQPDNFLKIKETLTRIGVASSKENTLYQSCHILHKKGRYYIVHFKEMFGLDGRPSLLTQDDIDRRNRIAILLEEWDLLTILNKEDTITSVIPLNKIKVLPFSEKSNWALVAKYNVGKKENR
jgi:hypothetical protein